MEPDSEEYQHKNSGDHVNMMEGTPMYTEGHGNSTGNTDYEGDEHEHQTRPTYPTLTSATSSEYRKEEVIDVHRDLESFANDTLEVDEGIATEVAPHLHSDQYYSMWTSSKGEWTQQIHSIPDQG
jgi:hypothetical protein